MHKQRIYSFSERFKLDKHLVGIRRLQRFLLDDSLVAGVIQFANTHWYLAYANNYW